MVACFAPLHYGFAVVHHQHEPSVQHQDAIWPAQQSVAGVVTQLSFEACCLVVLTRYTHKWLQIRLTVWSVERIGSCSMQKAKLLTGDRLF